MSKVISLRCFLRIGDRVVMQMDKEAREWGRAECIQGFSN